MFERVAERLRALGCDAWELTEERRRKWEFYCIRHRLDQNRAVDTTTLEAKVFRAFEADGKRFLGSAVGEIAPTASESEIDSVLSGLLYQAGLVQNPWYTLTDRPVLLPHRTERVDVERIARDFLRTIRAVPETETEDINSYEIFVSEVTRRTENSNGVRYECTYPSSMAEVIVNARRGDREIELYRNFTSGGCDGALLGRDIAEALRFGRDRLAAEPTPRLEESPVLFSGRDAVELYRWFVDRMSAGYKVRRFSDWEVGKPVFPWREGDRPTIEAVPWLENSSCNVPVDREGNEIFPRTLIRDGVAEQFWGSRQFSQYLGLERSSMVYNVAVSGGTGTEESLRRGDYLEPVEFSDFQVDPVTGDIAGEIRLAYWHHGGQTGVVTGGSVSGSMFSAAPSMTFSHATRQYDSYVIPALTRLESLRVTGITQLKKEN
ncbi:MAG: TldD/PmbA family protein [Oscillospiraceae bacterium]|nr:TldD/PmbA family protein [Oscillospiraceae bacterium]